MDGRVPFLRHLRHDRSFVARLSSRQHHYCCCCCRRRRGTLHRRRAGHVDRHGRHGRHASVVSEILDGRHSLRSCRHLAWVDSVGTCLLGVEANADRSRHPCRGSRVAGAAHVGNQENGSCLWEAGHRSRRGHRQTV